MVWVDQDSGSAPTNPLVDQLVIGAKNDHDVIELRVAGHGHDVLQQWPAPEGEELLRLAHPQRGAGSEDDPGARHGHHLIPVANGWSGSGSRSRREDDTAARRLSFRVFAVRHPGPAWYTGIIGLSRY
jgi:hypothetical protein